MKSPKNLLTFSIFLITIIILNVITFSFSDESSRLTVINRTGAYLHIYIEGTLYPYVAPDRNLTHVASAREKFYVEAFYSPGQNKSSVIIDSTITLPYTPAESYTYGDHCSCEDPNSSTSCSETEGVVNNPAQGGSAIWEITPSDFLSN
jgi:hypothetical protein